MLSIAQLNELFVCSYLGVLSKALRRKELRQLDEATEMKLRELMLKICKTIETCKHCGAFMDMGRVSLRENHVFKCPRCTKETCRVCGCDWAGHFGINCRLMAEEARRHRQRDLEDKMAMATIRNCPKCNVAIVKGDGCNNVHCNCGNGMCYICRQDIHFISYNHFCV